MSPTYNEDQIRSRHKLRVAALVDLFGSTHAIPANIIALLQERNKEDWVQHVAERDGKAKPEANAPLVPEVTDEEVAALDRGVKSVSGDGEDITLASPASLANPPYGSDEPDAKAIADAEDAVEILAEEPMVPGSDEDTCDQCGEELLWDAGERMYYCPNTYEHG